MRRLLVPLLSLSMACGGVYREVREVPGPTTTAVVAGPSAPLVVTSTFEKGRLVGAVRFSDDCATKTTTTIDRTEITTNTSQRGTGIATTIVGGILVGAGVVGLVAIAPSQSDERTCSTDSAGKETCSSPAGTARGLSVAGLVIGGVAVAVGLATIPGGKKVTEEKLSPSKREQITARGVPCGKREQLAGLEVALVGVGDPRVGRVDAEGRFVIDLGAAKPAKSDAARLVVHAVPPALLDRVANGATLASVDVAAWLGAVDAEAFQAQIAARKQADDHPFTGVVHGDQAARDVFTTACTPSGGKDVCGNALDDDCDGEVDAGCGWSSGALQWTVSWTSDDDLDLVVVGPDGVEVSAQNRNGGASRLSLDAECSGVGCAHRVENVFSPRESKPASGTYRAFVVVRKAASSADASRTIAATLGGRVGGRSYRMPLTLQAQDGVRISWAFAVGADADKDSVIDAEDRCPAEVGPWSEFAEDRGCPDRDHDGVADAHDACPDETGVRADDPKTHGCPKVYGSARLTARGVEITGTIQFATGKAELLPASSKILEDIGKVMKQEPQALQLVAIEGHTDSVGERAANMKLSRDRVQSVLDHLVKKQGIAPERLTMNWFGPDRPIADNASEAGKAKNRRVEFRVARPTPKAVSSW
ncbi:MAG: OmpA family protein [Deltaproteobacteria bacterium]|nr:OmpA family protein [Deltaproteobacteria bacterium]